MQQQTLHSCRDNDPSAATGIGERRAVPQIVTTGSGALEDKQIKFIVVNHGGT